MRTIWRKEYRQRMHLFQQAQDAVTQHGLQFLVHKEEPWQVFKTATF